MDFILSGGDSSNTRGSLSTSSEVYLGFEFNSSLSSLLLFGMAIPVHGLTPSICYYSALVEKGYYSFKIASK